MYRLYTQLILITDLLQDREANRFTESEPKTPVTSSTTAVAALEQEEVDRYSKFFASLTKKSGGSATNSPRATRSHET